MIYLYFKSRCNSFSNIILCYWIFRKYKIKKYSQIFMTPLYLGIGQHKPEPSTQLPGQLTLYIADPTLQRPHHDISLSSSLGVHQEQPKQILFQKDQLSIPHQNFFSPAQHTSYCGHLHPGVQNGKLHLHPKQIAGMEAKVYQMILRNIQKLSSQIYQHFSNQSTVHDQIIFNKVKRLEQIQSRSTGKIDELLERKEENIWQDEKIFDQKKYKLKKSIKAKIEGLLDQLLKEKQLQTQTKLHNLSQQLQLNNTQMSQKMEEFKEKMDQLEERLQLAIKEVSNRLSNSTREDEGRSQEKIEKIKHQLKINLKYQKKEELYKKKEQLEENTVIDCDEQQEERKRSLSCESSESRKVIKQEKKEKREKKEEIEKIMEAPQKLVDQTPFLKYFYIESNHITKTSGDGQFMMVLLHTVIEKEVFFFRIRLDKRKGSIWVGVTDRVSQREKNAAKWDQSVKYDCKRGNIHYGVGDKKAQIQKACRVEEGMEVLVKVDRPNCMVAFTIGQTTFVVTSPLLGDPDSQFVPCFQIKKIGDSITWQVE